MKPPISQITERAVSNSALLIVGCDRFDTAKAMAVKAAPRDSKANWISSWPDSARSLPLREKSVGSYGPTATRVQLPSGVPTATP